MVLSIIMAYRYIAILTVATRACQLIIMPHTCFLVTRPGWLNHLNSIAATTLSTRGSAIKFGEKAFSARASTS